MNTDTQKSRKEERMWAILLSEIENGNVIPIIGSELLCIESDGKCVQLDEYIIKKIAEDVLEIEYNESLTYTELSSPEYASKWYKLKSEIYFETKYILDEMPKSQPQTSGALRKLLEIDKFKVILTTSFDDYIFKAMEEKWGNGNVKELWYEKRSNKPDIDNLSSPLLYHLFGKANTIPNSYVLTEDDLLEFIHCWLNENYRPQHLANTLKEKYLLVIGCNYPNWLFRFFIQSMKNFSNTGTSKNSKIGMIADSKLSSDLLAFLSRISAQTHGNSITFIDELSERWKQHSKTNSEEKEEKEIFISYASEDYETAQKIADAFGNAGGQVWFDKRELDPSDKYAEIIRNKIKNSKAFVPILSLNTLTKEKRFFKGEWNWGIKEAELMGTQKFIYPIVIEEIDKASDILPEEFKEKHMIDYKNKDFENNIKKIIRDIR